MKLKPISKVHSCSSKDFELVKKYIQDFELDNRHLLQSEFLTLKQNDILLGFGRIREFSGFSELLSLGILIDQRSKGYGKLLCEALINKAKSTLYLVCIIPSFFEQFGFKPCIDFPLEIKEKLNYCSANLIVEEKYIVMKREADDAHI